MAIRFYTVGPNIVRKRKGAGSNNDDGDIQIDMSIELARQASELSRVSQAYADDSALSIASRLSQTSQISTSIKQQAATGNSVTEELAQYSATVNQNVTDIVTAVDSVKTLGQAVADWPLYTDETYGYSQRFRDESINNISLVVSGTESSSYTTIGGTSFFDINPMYSGIYNTATTSANTTPFLVNDVDEDISAITLGTSDPFSIEFLLNYTSGASNGYIVNFGEQYQVKVASNTLSCVVNNIETSSSIDLTTNAGNWSHIVLSYDPIERSVTAYEDGEISFKDTNIGIPGSVPTDSKIRILEGVEGKLNDLRIYKASLSNSTVISLYNSYKTRYTDFESGAIYASNTISGNNTPMVNPQTGVFKGFNIARSIYQLSTVVKDKSITPTDTTSTLNNTTGMPFSHLSIDNYCYTLLSFDYLKLPGEDNLVFSTYLIDAGTSAPEIEYFIWVKSVDGSTYPASVVSGVLEYGASGKFVNLYYDLTDVPDMNLYRVELRMANKDFGYDDTYVSNLDVFTLTDFARNVLVSGLY